MGDVVGVALNCFVFFSKSESHKKMAVPFRVVSSYTHSLSSYRLNLIMTTFANEEIYSFPNAKYGCEMTVMIS